MRSFLVKSLIFFIPAIIVIIFIEITIRALPNVYKYKNDYLLKHKEEIEVLILGHSQLESGVIPENINLKAFSFAIDGQSLRYDYQIFEKYVDQLPRLKYIVIPVSNFSLYFEMSKSGVTSNRTVNYPLYLHLNSGELPFYKQFECTSPGFQDKMRSIITKINNRESERSCLTLGNSTQDINGVFDTKNWDRMANAEEEWQYKCIENGVSIMRQNKERLMDLIRKCEKRNIEVIIVTPPVAAIYHNLIDDKIKRQLNDTFNFCTEVDKSFKNVVYINLYNANDFLDIDYFNPTHLNLNGAKKLTKYINQIISNGIGS